MKIKERGSGQFLTGLSTLSKSIWKVVSSKPMKIIVTLCIILGIFVAGVLGGMIFSGVFGTFEDPSQRAINLVHAFGIGGLRDLQSKVDAVKEENVKIPFNYLGGLFSNPKKIYIDVAFEDYQKIAFKRAEALELGLLITSDDDEVPAEITLDGEKVRTSIRLKGDNTDHISGDKWSLRVKVKGDDTILGMEKFSLQAPERRNQLNEWIYLEALKREDVLSVRYDFVEVIINGNNMGIYALEEHFDKHILENQERREGPILKFEADEKRNQEFLREQTDFSRIISEEFDFYPTSVVSVFKPNTVLRDPVKTKEFNEGKNLLESFRQGEIGVNVAFDTEVLSRYFAVTTLLGGHHAALWSNMAFYYNPITSKLEPIGFDAEIGNNAYEGIDPYAPKCFTSQNRSCLNPEDYFSLFFSDQEFYERYIVELERVSEEEYLDDLFVDLDSGIEKNLDIIHGDYPAYHFPKTRFYEFRENLEAQLGPEKVVNSYFQEQLIEDRTIVLFVGNTHSLPLRIKETIYNDTFYFPVKKDEIIVRRIGGHPTEYRRVEFRIPDSIEWKEEYVSNLEISYEFIGSIKRYEDSVLPWPYVDEDFLSEGFTNRIPNAEKFSFLEIDHERKLISFDSENLVLDENLILPPGFKIIARTGTSIDLINNAVIVSYSPLEFIGSIGKPILVTSSDGTGQGLTILDAKSESIIRNVDFSNLGSLRQGNWELTGMVTFYESPISMQGVKISNARAEDAINIVRSDFSIKSLEIVGTDSDCIDIDFGFGVIEDFILTECGNDGLDFSGSDVSLSGGEIVDSVDKGISIGEGSVSTMESISVEGSYLGVAGKDQSEVEMNNVHISGTEYAFAVYQKKSEFGPASIRASNVDLVDNGEDFMIEEGNTLEIDGDIVLDKTRKVFAKLYPGG